MCHKQNTTKSKLPFLNIYSKREGERLGFVGFFFLLLVFFFYFLFSHGSQGISLVLCKGDLIWVKMSMESKFYSSQLSSPTLLLQHGRARSEVDVGERDLGLQELF